MEPGFQNQFWKLFHVLWEFSFWVKSRRSLNYLGGFATECLFLSLPLHPPDTLDFSSLLLPATGRTGTTQDAPRWMCVYIEETLAMGKAVGAGM